MRTIQCKGKFVISNAKHLMSCPISGLCVMYDITPLPVPGMCYLTLQVRLKYSPGLPRAPSSQTLWSVGGGARAGCL